MCIHGNEERKYEKRKRKKSDEFSNSESTKHDARHRMLHRITHVASSRLPDLFASNFCQHYDSDRSHGLRPQHDTTAMHESSPKSASFIELEFAIDGRVSVPILFLVNRNVARKVGWKVTQSERLRIEKASGG